MASKKRASKRLTREEAGETQAFVLSFPESKAASEVIEAAKEKGVELTAKYIYNTRYNARKARKKELVHNRARTEKARKTRAANTRRKQKNVEVEEQAMLFDSAGDRFRGQLEEAKEVFLAIASEIGLGYAMALLVERRLIVHDLFVKRTVQVNL